MPSWTPAVRVGAPEIKYADIVGFLDVTVRLRGGINTDWLQPFYENTMKLNATAEFHEATDQVKMRFRTVTTEVDAFFDKLDTAIEEANATYFTHHLPHELFTEAEEEKKKKFLKDLEEKFRRPDEPEA